MFCDVEEDTYLMDIKKLSRLLSQSPKGTYKGIVLVDFAGYPANLEAFRQLADEYGLWIIEDACHAPVDILLIVKVKSSYVAMGTLRILVFFRFIR